MADQTTTQSEQDTGATATATSASSASVATANVDGNGLRCEWVGCGERLPSPSDLYVSFLSLPAIMEDAVPPTIQSFASRIASLHLEANVVDSRTSSLCSSAPMTREMGRSFCHRCHVCGIRSLVAQAATSCVP
jgi:hypothetical protein